MVFILCVYIVRPTDIYSQTGNGCINTNPSTCFDQWVAEFTGVEDTLLTDFKKDGKITLADFEFIRRQAWPDISSTITMGPTLTSSLSLKSDYFSADPTASQIINADLTGLTLRDEPELNIVPNQTITINYETFQLKVSSALIMLGYAWEDTEPKKIGEKPQTLLIRAQAFMRSNSLPITDVITPQFLSSLDQSLWAHEQSIKQLADKLPIDESFTYNNQFIRYIPHHPNLVSKNHVKFFYSYLFSQLPSYLAPFSLKSTYEYFSMQGHMIEEKSNEWQFTYIDSINHSSLYVENEPDVYMAQTFYHEFAHQTDAAIYRNYNPTSGMVDTQGFYSILFDTSDCIQEQTRYCKIRPDARVFSGYSLLYDLSGHPGYFKMSEAYAEAFSAYVSSGNLFRKLASLNASFEQQYSWLKANAFQGIEYCTGDADLISYGTQWDYVNNKAPNNNFSDVIRAYVETHTTVQQPMLGLGELIKKCSQ